MDLRVEPRPAERRWSFFGRRAEPADSPEDLSRDNALPPQCDSAGGPDDEKGPRRHGRAWWISRGIAAALLAFFLLIAWLAVTAPLSKSLQPIAPPQITLLAADGTPIARNGAIVDEPIRIPDLPPHVVNAFISIEDRRFYEHWGLDPRALARAAWGNFTSSRTQGGSTITQQLAKFTFLTPERSLTRKVREALIAFWLEAWLTKDEILERYLSNAYFGDNVYGLRAASLHYFYRKPENLRPEQAAMLAGLLQAPSRYVPTRNYDLAEKRMRTVLHAMVDAGHLDAATARALSSPRLDVRTRNTLPTGTYFADWALPQARKLSDVSYARQTIRTTLDSRLQTAARRAIERAPLGKAQVALVAMRPNGEVVAMVGGTDYARSSFNRATQARRQPGSTFKLFVWLAALEAGWKPDDRIDNSAIEAGAYRPRNAGGRYSASLTLEEAFARSSNVAAVRLLGEVGDAGVIKAARKLGVQSPLPQGDPSLALGTSTMTLIELTAAYAGIAANRFPVAPRAFAAEEPGLFDWLFGKTASLSGRKHRAMEQMLRAAINRGTGRRAMLSEPNFGKTGTSQDNRDALFVGYAGELVVGVWIGNDDNSPLTGISGGGLPAQIWRDFMRQARRDTAAPAPRRATQVPDPTGPVEPLDVPDATDIPLPDVPAGVQLRDGGAEISTEVGGIPVGVRVDRGGFSIEADELRRQVEERARTVETRAREEQQRVQEEINRAVDGARPPGAAQ